MNVINIIHNKAIEFADEAIIAQYKGSPSTVKELYYKAFQLEKEAALHVPLDSSDLVPRFVLMRSAASLAMLSEQFEEAEKLIALGLSSSPPKFIKEELLTLSEEVKERKENQVKTNFIQLIGLFTYANANENEIKIQDSNPPFLHTFIAPAKQIKMLVREHFLEKVSVIAHVSTSGILLMKEMKKAI
ncbi:MAG: hypothetical protein ACPGVB_07270 [Chitinophagales bacterium]